MLNVICLTGRISKAPEKKVVGETTFVNFDIAVDNPTKEADGSRGTTFITCVAFNSLAEAVDKFLTKGSKCSITGALRQRSWLNKDGDKRSTYEIVVDGLDLLDPKKEDTPETKEEATPKFDPYTGKPIANEKKSK